ncbi:hypothetical protein [Mycobacterium sp. OAE908]|uniref:aromatic-ring-hydroxylating dioxygenase subunit beta n=1 Tax=Mycobacterium sp. OAE908 TaxID=2817899 RepID=UPI001AE5A8E8
MATRPPSQSEEHVAMTTTERTADTWVSAETLWAISKFLIDEAELLDQWRYSDWARCITDDFRYEVPIPITRDDPTRGAYADKGFVAIETRSSLEYWFRRHDPGLFEYAWGENPLQRVNRFLTNIRATQTPGEGVVRVSAKELVSFSRQSDPAVLITADRDDVLVPNGDSWLLAHRRVRLHQTVLDTPHLRIIF